MNTAINIRPARSARRLTFAWRLALTSMLVTALGMVLLAASLLLLVGRYEAERREAELTELARSEAAYLGELSTLSGLAPSAAYMVDRFAGEAGDPQQLAVRVFGLGGELMASSSTSVGYFPSAAAARLTRSPLPLMSDETSRRFVAEPVLVDGRQVGVVELSEGLQEERRLLRLISVVLAQGTVVALFVACLVSIVLGRALGLRFERLQRVAVGMAGGDLGQRAPERGPHELSELARSLNAMAAQLQERMRQIESAADRERLFYRDVAHELRTPLTALQGYLEDLEDTAAPEQTAALDAMRREVQRLARLAGDLSGPPSNLAAPLRREPVDLAELVLELARALRGRAERAGVALRPVVEGSPPPTRGDSDRLKQALLNLFDNALRHTPPGGSVELAVRVADGVAQPGVEVQVSDTGPGVDPALGDSIWARGVHGAGGRSGLGLAIVREIVLAHGGEVELLPQGPGAHFLIRLPAFTPVHRQLTGEQ